ncbi:MAG: mechanosensitive ion channel family protein [Gomphosphaeria aponina SAG 52.96 = DSM 107014]|uniref:Mechanosensitive ion channel family protein n=1 Tax=Gomphosphaeria aponina SAG 52.96 = DSM 107014 TaxID=1521640 RepID=A0A941GUJ7_9CHRO|nr:mechanosensitive ion channel family protein [Gomphosphaeria aponina SAG 52.96 = DSM 107014]
MDKFLIILRWVSPVVIVLCSLALGLGFEKRVLKKLKEITAKTSWEGDDLIIDSLENISVLWFLLGGIYLAIPTIPLPDSLITVINKILTASFLASATLVISRLAIDFIQLYTSRRDSSATLTSLFEYITKIAIFTLGGLIIIQAVGIPITPLLTAFGVGGVSLGLAFKDTLANLLSGINIIVSKKIRPGDYLQLKTGEEGYVVDVELKYTVIREITGNMVVIPNSYILAYSFKNYALPEKQMLIPVQVGISYESDLETVEAVTLEVAKEVMEQVEAGITEYEPFMRYNEFDYFSINLTVYLAVKDYYDQLIVKHEFIKRLHKRYREEGIKIPFPIQAGYMTQRNGQDEASQKLSKENFQPPGVKKDFLL